ncbi:MAG TPA: ABC transporter permease [Cyclobacteriaceae bacterium]|nr:ABC transporter permease [Cyclobacteriaceae bacterium]
MVANYLRLFFRNLRRQKLFSTINLLGLTVSMVSTTLIYLYVRHEFSYDQFHQHAERIYRVNQTFIWGENDNHQFASTGPGVAFALKEELPEVELLTSIHTPGNFLVSYQGTGTEVINEETNVLAADSNFFRMFNFPFVAGDPLAALNQAQGLVLTESAAHKYFGDINPIGKLLRFKQRDNDQTFEVTGVVKDLPSNSYLQFDMLMSLRGFGLERRSWSWIWTQLETYIRVAPGTDINNTLTKLALIPKKHADVSLRRAMNTSYDEYIKSGKKWELFLQPLTRIHLPEEVVYNRLNDSGNIVILYALIGAAIFIVLLSCINFMNLTTAQFTRRIREAGVRKVLGVSRGQLSFNHWLEAFTFCVVALVVSLGITELVLPAFNLLIGKPLALHLFSDSNLWMAALVLIIVMSVLSGTYPAFYLSSFHPVEALKGLKRQHREGWSLRNVLVVFQFSVSLILLIATAVVFDQLNFVSRTDLGFDRENLVVVQHIENMKNGDAFTKAATQLPGVMVSSRSSSVPPSIYGGDSFTAEGTNGLTLPINFTTADEQYIPALKIPLLVGRNFSEEFPGDEKRVIVNEAAIRKIGWPTDESVLGKKIMIPGEDIGFEIIGVMKDFHYWSLENTIEPMAIFHINSTILGTGDAQYATLRIQPQDESQWKTTLSSIEELWKTHAGDLPFQYTFVDDAFAQTFRTQQQFGSALLVLAGLAVIIACLGLLGMVLFMLEQRSKEIGIRKVAGASVWNILTLITGSYARLILIAFVLAAPLAYWMMNLWLESFAYRVTPSLLVIGAIGLSTLGVAMLISAYHCIQAARTNPVTVLRDE